MKESTQVTSTKKRHQCKKPPFSQPERSEKRLKDVMVSKDKKCKFITHCLCPGVFERFIEGGNSPKIAYIEKYADVVFASETEVLISALSEVLIDGY